MRPATARRAQPRLEGIAFVVAVWLAWRTVHLLLGVAHGGDPIRAVFTLDGEWYRKVLEHGYVVTDPTFHEQENLAFFPGIVWLASPLRWMLGSHAAAHLVATVTSFGAFAGLHQAALALTEDRLVARRAVVALALWPMSMVMAAFYSEGLLITASTVAIWALRHDRAPIATSAGVVAALSRSVGVLVGPGLAVARVATTRRVDRTAVLFAASGPIGLALVAVAQGVATGHPFGFLEAQDAWNRDLAPPWAAVQNVVQEIGRSHPQRGFTLAWIIDVVVVVGLAVVLGWLTRTVWRQRTEPTPPAHRAAWVAAVIWGWGAWYTTVLTHTMASAARFGLAMWPAFVAVGMVRGRHERTILRVLAYAAFLLTLAIANAWADGLTNPLYT